MNNTLSFQYCQKIIVFSEDRSSVLLAKRKGEADYNDIYSFIGVGVEEAKRRGTPVEYRNIL